MENKVNENMNYEVLNLSTYTINALRRACGADLTVGELKLLYYSNKLLKYRNFGPKTIAEIRNALDMFYGNELLDIPGSDKLNIAVGHDIERMINRLFDASKVIGMSLHDLSILSGVSYNDLSRYESLKSFPRLDIYLKLCIIVGIKVIV